ncbi:MAG TPA: glycosyltransferase family 4 protein [Methylomirabilota bacterium]
MDRVPGFETADARKVLFIENSIGLSGSTMSLCTLLAEIDRSRYAPRVVLSLPNQQEYLAQAVGPSIPTAVLPWRNSLKSTPWIRDLLGRTSDYPRLARRVVTGSVAALDVPAVILPYVRRLYRIARRWNIDLIHHNNGLDVRAVLLARWLGVPLIAYQRGTEWNSPTVRYISRFVDAYVANSTATKGVLLGLGVPSERIGVIYPPIDMERFHPKVDASRQRSEFGLGPDDVTFGIPGTLLKWKGHDVFLKAAKVVLGAVPRAKAFVIGEVPDGSTEYRDELIALARELGIGARTVFTGFRRDIPELIQLLDVVVHASVKPEPFGRVIAEGMAMGKPVVAAMNGGPLEIIREGETGFLVPPGDAEKLAHRIIELLTDRSRAELLGRNARQDSAARFSPGSHARLVEQVYDNVLTAHRDHSRQGLRERTTWQAGNRR